MYRLFQQFWQIALLKIAPQELPGQAVVLWIGCAAAFVTSVAGLLFGYTLSEALVRSVLVLSVSAVLIYILLRSRSMQHRFTQSFAAMCGASSVIYFLALPLMPYFLSVEIATAEGKLLFFVILLFDLWVLLITANILRHSLDISFSNAMSLAVALTVLSIVAIESITPSKRSNTDTVVSGYANEHLRNDSFKHTYLR